MTARLVTLLIMMVWAIFPATAAALTLSELIGDIRENHPRYLAASAKTDGVFASIEEASALFDPTISQNAFARSEGYYDGRFIEQRLSQPLRALNADMYGSYRLSAGQFPIYERQYQTLSSGEISFGVNFSLLKNRDIDARRMASKSAVWRHAETQAQEKLVLNALLYAGIDTYLLWLQDNEKLRIAKDLLFLSETRALGLAKRINDGDLADIALVELEATILRRKAMVSEIKQSIVNHAEKLRFFLSDDVFFEPINSTFMDVSATWAYSSKKPEYTNLNLAVKRHPLIQSLQGQRERSQIEKRLAANETLPTLDLDIKYVKDLGGDDGLLSGDETIVALNFELPIGQRAASARLKAATNKLTEIDYELRAKEQELVSKARSSLSALDYAEQIVSTRKKAEIVARDLLKKENLRFDEGTSDQFLLISREKQSLDARMAVVQAEYALLRGELALAATLALLE